MVVYSSYSPNREHTMTSLISESKQTILGDLLVAFHLGRSPVDARFALAHEALTGLELFPKKNSFITFVSSEQLVVNRISGYGIIQSIAQATADAIKARYITSDELANDEDIVHFVLDCRNYDETLALLKKLSSRNSKYSALVQLVNADVIDANVYQLLSTVIPDMQYNGAPLYSTYFINTMTAQQLDDIDSDLAAKFVLSGLVIKGE